ncbi:hypothetical protein HL653_15555 [Sphingomonas sp. AP4-R1]|uniref:ArnT family glycosyltransferase n=1 Tax=Sphingomonas sp. AP4-R1 TaxID=2735134 RepID=UPI0014933209|nr:glycosyltransferase family 39 protein [Sphingomonas sp. AP4-R1]QJU58991.1 hypothetical protein HL653_15555 [Sphingomonas sp. AP4-R1]
MNPHRSEPSRLADPAVRIFLSALLLVLAAFLIRAPSFGNPIYEIDEQFYLLVGDRMLHGAVPYVDIWDRKPIGLFLIYAGARLFGGGGLVSYQVIATLCAAGTAFCILALSRRVAGLTGATAAGILYLLWIEVAEGGGGQSPIFYNLPMAGAAVLLIAPAGPRDRERGFLAMLLVGIAIQIKYSVVFEGFFFGLIAAWKAWRRSPRAALIEIPALALTALAPTFAAIAAYAAIGHLHEYWFANFTSIFLRGETPVEDLHQRARVALVRLVPLTVCAAAAAWHVLRGSPDREARRWLAFMGVWCAVAVAGFSALGVLYSHYLLPVFVPFTAAAAPIFRRWPTGPALLGIAAWLPASNLHWPDFATTARSQRQMADLSALVPPDVSHGCMQMFDGPPILYYLTRACTVSRFVFPDHLSAANENGAIGVDAATETRRVLAARPLVITIGDNDVRPPNRKTFAIMREGLARSYRWAGHAWVDDRFVSVYVRR